MKKLLLLVLLGTLSIGANAQKLTIVKNAITSLTERISKTWSDEALKEGSKSSKVKRFIVSAFKADADEVAEAVVKESTKEIAETKVAKELSLDAVEAAVPKQAIGKYTFKTVTELEAKEIALRFQSQFSHLDIKPEFVDKLYGYCKKIGVTDETDIIKIVEQFDLYSKILVQERNELSRLAKAGTITAEQLHRLEVVKSMFKKNGEILNANNIQHYLNLLKRQKYVKNDLVSPERFAHIILRHGSESCQKSYFNNFCGDRLFKEIQGIVSDKANYIGKDGDTDFYVKTFNEVVGFDEIGNPIKELLVVMRGGKVITSYPPRKRNLEILLDKCVKPAVSLAA